MLYGYNSCWLCCLKEYLKGDIIVFGMNGKTLAHQIFIVQTIYNFQRN